MAFIPGPPSHANHFILSLDLVNERFRVGGYSVYRELAAQELPKEQEVRK
jgi:hypothetical protein